MVIPEPIILTELIFTIGESLLRVYKFAKSVKDAKKDIKVLCDELFALKGVLEHINAQLEAAKEDGQSTEISIDAPEQLPQLFGTKEFSDMLRATSDFLRDLLRGLERPKGHLKSALQSMAWPFTKDEVQEHIARLERVKSWFIFAMISDGVSVPLFSYARLTV